MSHKDVLAAAVHDDPQNGGSKTAIEAHQTIRSICLAININKAIELPVSAFDCGLRVVGQSRPRKIE